MAKSDISTDFRLIRARADAPGGSRIRRFVSREEILQIVADIASEATGARAEHLLSELADLRTRIPADWRDGEVLAAFGDAYSQLGKSEEAIAAYRQALADEGGKAPVRAAQQIANLLDRQDGKGIWKQRIRECEEAAVRQRDEKRDVWARAGVVDAMLLRSLWEGALAENQKKIAHEYVKVIKGGGSQREIDSILGQIDFLKANLPEGDVLRVPLEAILREVRANPWRGGKENS
jgi:tetratricopeptide (TPR) repeat protein